MKSDVVLVIGIMSLAVLGLVSCFAFTEGTAKIMVGSIIGLIATICGVQGGVAIRSAIMSRHKKD